MVEEVLERTDGETKLWPATLYGSLRDLEEAGWIRETPAPDEAPGEGGRRRFYELTVEGRTTLQGELAHLRDIVAVAQDRGLLGKSGA